MNIGERGTVRKNEKMTPARRQDRDNGSRVDYSREGALKKGKTKLSVILGGDNKPTSKAKGCKKNRD